MKRYIYLVTAMMFVILGSCEKGTIVNDSVENQGVVCDRSSIFPEKVSTSILDEGTKTGWDYNSAEKSYTHHWDENDEILVYKDGKVATYRITSQADAASGIFTYIEESTNYGGYNGAEYIATYNIAEGSVSSAGVSVSQNDVYHGNYNSIMIAKSSSTDSFTFKHVLGWMKLQLTGNKAVSSVNINSDILISGGFDIDFNGEVTDTGNMEYPYITMDYSADPIQLDEESATAIYVPMIPMDYTFTKKLKNVEVVFTDGERVSMNLPTSITIDRNKVTPLSEKFFGTRAQWVNANKEYRANCYYINSGVSGIEDRIYKFMATYKGNSAEANISGGVRAAVLWETANTPLSEGPVSAGIIVPEAWYANGNIYFKVTPNCKGNAVIALYDESDNILWSWHIWVPGVADETVTTITVEGSLRLMQDNLGAVPSSTDLRAKAGLYYQWGRKDPFAPRAVALGENRMATVPADVFVVSSLHPSNHAEDHPSVFYSSTYGWRYPSNSDEWSDTEKTIYDPCPHGWRVMRKTSLASVLPGTSKIVSYNSSWDFVNTISNLGCQNTSASNFSSLTDYSVIWTAAADPGVSDANKPSPWSLNNNNSIYVWLYQTVNSATGAFVRCERE